MSEELYNKLNKMEKKIDKLIMLTTALTTMETIKLEHMDDLTITESHMYHECLSLVTGILDKFTADAEERIKHE